MALTYEELAKVEKPVSKFISPVYCIIVIGCGGTGSQLIPDLIRAYKFANNKNTMRGNGGITLIDGDTVELKNIERQNFIPKDIGKNKAEVLAKRYGQVFGIPVKFRDQHITSKEDIKNILNPLNYNNYRRDYKEVSIIISCVDNHYVRKLIHQAFMELTQSTFWIDSGNEDKFGQIICGYQPPNGTYFGDSKYNNGESIRERIIGNWIKLLDRTKGHRMPIPDVCEIFQEILEAEPPKVEDVSCAEVAEVRPQNILINRIAATAIMSYIYPCLYINGTINEDGMASYSNILTHYMTLFNINGECSKKTMLVSEFKTIFKKAYTQLDLP